MATFLKFSGPVCSRLKAGKSFSEGLILVGFLQGADQADSAPDFLCQPALDEGCKARSGGNLKHRKSAGSTGGLCLKDGLTPTTPMEYF